MHGFTGMWGLIAVGIFDNVEGLIASDAESKGKYFLWQLIGMFAIIAWTAVLSALYFVLIKKLGILRVPLLEEIVGLDIAEMGSKAHISHKVEDQIIRSETIRKSSTLRRGRSTDQMRSEFGEATKFKPGINDEVGSNPKVQPEEVATEPFAVKQDD